MFTRQVNKGKAQAKIFYINNIIPKIINNNKYIVIVLQVNVIYHVNTHIKPLVFKTALFIVYWFTFLANPFKLKALAFKSCLF